MRQLAEAVVYMHRNGKIFGQDVVYNILCTCTKRKGSNGNDLIACHVCTWSIYVEVLEIHVNYALMSCTTCTHPCILVHHNTCTCRVGVFKIISTYIYMYMYVCNVQCTITVHVIHVHVHMQL